jgi:predicted NUDIX family phosphoesterase
MSEKKNLERDILVVKTKETLFIKEGFTEASKEEVLELEKKGQYENRNKMEIDENFQQLIPYIAIKKDNKILSYQRSKKGGEGRLFDKYSIGVGGHIDAPDSLVQSAIREVKEEIDIDILEKDLSFVGFINITKTPVDRVHIGVAVVVEINENLDFSKGEIDKITKRSFDDKNKLEEKSSKFEI